MFGFGKKKDDEEDLKSLSNRIRVVNNKLSQLFNKASLIIVSEEDNIDRLTHRLDSECSTLAMDLSISLRDLGLEWENLSPSKKEEGKSKFQNILDNIRNSIDNFLKRMPFKDNPRLKDTIFDFLHEVFGTNPMIEEYLDEKEEDYV